MKDVLVKILGEGGFRAFVGLRPTKFEMGNTVPGTSPMLLRRTQFSGIGIFSDKKADEKGRDLFFSGRDALFQIVMSEGHIQGRFNICALEFLGVTPGEKSYHFSFVSEPEVAWITAPTGEDE